MEKKLLIVGIDPGTTLGYAIFDTGKDLLAVGSSRLLDISLLTTEIISHGKPVIVACDKKRTPDFVSKVATRLGARIISPEEDMLVHDKKAITKGLSFNNCHEMDALASALFALKKIGPLLSHIDDYLNKAGKQHFKSKLSEIMLLNPELSMKNIIGMLERPEKEENRIMKIAIEEKAYTKNDCMKLFSRIRELESRNSSLMEQNKKLSSLVDSHRNMMRKLDLQIVNLSKKEARDKRVLNLRKSISSLSSKLSSSDSEAEGLKNEISLIYSFLSDTNRNVVLKKLDNLGSSEFDSKKFMLNIQEGDILLVGNPSIISYNVLEHLKRKVSFIISREKASSSLLENYGITIIPAKNLFLREERYFALVDKDALKKETVAACLINNVISRYRNERSRA